MGEAVIGPDMDDLVERADLAGEEADQLAEQALLDRQAALAVEGDPFRRLAGLHRVGAFLDNHRFSPRCGIDRPSMTGSWAEIHPGGASMAAGARSGSVPARRCASVPP